MILAYMCFVRSPSRLPECRCKLSTSILFSLLLLLYLSLGIEFIEVEFCFPRARTILIVSWYLLLIPTCRLLYPKVLLRFVLLWSLLSLSWSLVLTFISISFITIFESNRGNLLGASQYMYHCFNDFSFLWINIASLELRMVVLYWGIEWTSAMEFSSSFRRSGFDWTLRICRNLWFYRCSRSFQCFCCRSRLCCSERTFSVSVGGFIFFSSCKSRPCYLFFLCTRRWSCFSWRIWLCSLFEIISTLCNGDLWTENAHVFHWMVRFFEFYLSNR